MYPQLRVSGEASFISWLYTIANHAVVSYLRKWRRAAQVSLTLDLHLADGRASNMADIICDCPALREAFSHLTWEQQHVLTRKFFGGLSNLEIAQHMRRTEGAVKALQSRAIQHLQRLLTDAYVDQLAVASCGPTLVFVSYLTPHCAISRNFNETYQTLSCAIAMLLAGTGRGVERSGLASGRGCPHTSKKRWSAAWT